MVRRSEKLFGPLALGAVQVSWFSSAAEDARVTNTQKYSEMTSADTLFRDITFETNCSARAACAGQQPIGKVGVELTPIGFRQEQDHALTRAQR